MLRNSHRGRPAGSAIRKTIRPALLTPDAPVTREGPRQSTRRRLAAPSHPERPWSLVDRCPARTRTDEERGRRCKGEKKTRVLDVDVFVRLCVVQSAVISHLFKRGLNFPYSTRTQILVKTVKKPSQTRICQIPLGPT